MKKMVNKQLAVLFAITIMMSCFMISSFADSALTFTISDATCKAGDKVTVPVTLTGNQGITGWNIWISYDNSVMNLDSVKAADCDFKDAGDFDIGEDLTANPFSIMCDGKKSFNTEGTMAELTFSVNNTAAEGKYEIEFYTDMTMATIDDEGTPDSNLVLKNGTVTVESKPESKAASKPESKVESKAASKPESKVESKVASKPESKIESKPESKVESKTESTIGTVSVVSAAVSGVSSDKSASGSDATVSGSGSSSKNSSTTSNTSGTSSTNSSTSSTSSSKSSSTSSSNNPSSPKTGTATPLAGTVVLLLASAAAMVSLGKRKED